MQAATLAYLLGFSAVYVVTLAVVLNFASGWRRRMQDAKDDSRAKSVRRLVRLNAAAADVHDALAYQKRTNEAARARIRAVERDARDNAEHAERNHRMLDESREANARLVSRYAAGTGLLGQHAQNIYESADRARRQSLSRAEENARLLRELEKDIDSMVKGAVTPAEVEAEVRRLEAELAADRRDNQDASAGFYAKVDELLEASEQAQKDIGDEISTMYATRDEAQLQASELEARVAEARDELEAQYVTVSETAEAAEAECGLRNADGALDGAALDQVRSSYDELVSKLADYTRMIDENEDKWSEVDSKLREAEERANESRAEIDRALEELEQYIESNCTSAESVAGLEARIAAAKEACEDSAEAA